VRSYVPAACDIYKRYEKQRERKSEKKENKEEYGRGIFLLIVVITHETFAGKPNGGEEYL